MNKHKKLYVNLYDVNGNKVGMQVILKNNTFLKNNAELKPYQKDMIKRMEGLNVDLNLHKDDGKTKSIKNMINDGQLAGYKVFPKKFMSCNCEKVESIISLDKPVQSVDVLLGYLNQLKEQGIKNVSIEVRDSEK